MWPLLEDFRVAREDQKKIQTVVVGEAQSAAAGVLREVGL